MVRQASALENNKDFQGEELTDSFVKLFGREEYVSSLDGNIHVSQLHRW